MAAWVWLRLRLFPKIFKWKYFVVVWGSVLTLVGLAGDDWLDASRIWFAIAYLLGIMASVWTALTWLYSDLLKTKSPLYGNRARRRRATPADIQTYKRIKWGGVVAVGIGWLCFTAIVVAIQIKQEKKMAQAEQARQMSELQEELKQLNGRVYPASDPTPEHRCGQVGKDDLIVFAGSNVSISNKFPHTILRVKGKDVLTVDKGGDGSLLISFDVLDREGKVIAQLRDGKYTLGPQRILPVPRKDRHSLTVIDEYGTEVLDLRYINPHTAMINAVLVYPDREPLRLNETGIRYGGFSMSGYCGVHGNGPDLSLE